MDTLNHYLKSLLSSCSDELRLEPDRIPYLVSQDKTTELTKVPLVGTQISTMVFPLIPPNVKAVLPHNSEVEFVLSHDLGNFNFTVQKSPAGFVVAVRPLLNDMPQSSPALPDEAPAFGDEPDTTPAPETPSFISQPLTEPAATYITEPARTYEYPAYEPEQLPDPAPALDAESVPTLTYDLESSSAGNASSSSVDDAAADDLLIGDLLYEATSSASEYVPGAVSEPHVDVVTVNDAEYQTVFSDTAAYEPPSPLDDLVTSENIPDTAVGTPQSAPPAQYTPDMQETLGYQPEPPPYAPTPAAVPFSPAAAVNTDAMDRLFHKMAELGASDLHLSVSMPPMIRKDGKISKLDDSAAALTAESARELLRSIMPARNQEEFAARRDTDFAYEIKGLARFRCNIFEDRKGMGGVFRIIPARMTTAEQLGLSPAILGLCDLSKGLVVVTGPTGSGKSTTLCAMVNHINMQREDHIITIEDPIEFVHDNYKCLVNQREVHNHTQSFKDALRAALREDPDIVLVGEMRDLDTMSIAIETAETGHLVFGTLHTTTAASTVDRIIDQFPPDRQQQVRVMLSESLKGVVAQTLLPKKGGGRVAALEVLIVTPAISNLIREGKTFQIPSAMQTGKTHGMVMLNDALYEHVKNGTVEPLDAYIKAVDKPNFETMLTRGGFKI